MVILPRTGSKDKPGPSRTAREGGFGGEEVRKMSGQQIAHVEEQLICFIDRVVDRNENATPAEIAALSEVTLALAEIHRL